MFEKGEGFIEGGVLALWADASIFFPPPGINRGGLKAFSEIKEERCRRKKTGGGL